MTDIKDTDKEDNQLLNKATDNETSNAEDEGVTHLSMTELEGYEQKLNDPDATQMIPQAPKAIPSEGTVLSSTAVKAFEQTDPPDKVDADATVMIPPGDPDATQLVTDETVHLDGQTEATILAGGTQAIKQAVEPSFSPKVSIGSVINDRFSLEKLLGRGGMGEVYLATDKRKLEAQDKNPYVALKVLGDNFKHHPQAFIALQREARKTQELAHPNIVTVYDFDRQGDTVYLTMEAMTGKPMDEEIRSDIRPLDEAVHMIFQCSNGLAYAHKKDLVHSDLKPGNLFLTDDGNVKLLDFGIARAFKSGKELEDKDHAGNDTVFDAGELGALTPAYASLEMIEGEEPHPSDDVYALGLIAYELLTGKHPFDKKMASKAKEEGMAAEKIPGLNKQQWKAIESALAFERENRIQHAQEFLDIFTAKSKTPLYIGSTVIALAFAAIASFSFLKEPALGPEIAFADLPVETQQQVTSQLTEAQTALKFNDYNSALIFLNNAFLAHQYNPDVMDQLDGVINLLLEKFSDFDKETQLKQVNSLLQYEALSSNQKLLDYKKSIE